MLLIIGFLLSTITVASSLIRSSRVNSAIAQLEKLDTVSNVFREKYFGYAGDIIDATASFGSEDSMGNTVYNGNADGFIGDTSPFETESLSFFHHLFLANMIAGVYEGGSISSVDDILTGTHYPKTKLGVGTYIYVRSDAISNKFVRQNRFAISSLTTDGVVDPYTAASFDRKIDDGKPLTGKVIAGTLDDMELAFHEPVIKKQKSIVGLINKAYASEDEYCITQGFLSSMNSKIQLENATYNTGTKKDVCVIIRSLNKKDNEINPALSENPTGDCVVYPGKSFYRVSGWSGETDDGNVISGKCRSGYKGSVRLKCNTGIWVKQSGLCSQIYCGSIKSPTTSSGFAKWPESKAGGKALGVCDSNYVGNPVRSCSFSGRWQKVSNPCIALSVTSCFAINLGNEDSGFAKWPESDLNRTIDGICENGYSGSPIRKCTSDGIWEEISNPCVSDCYEITKPEKITGYATWEQALAGLVVTGSCMENYSGSPTRRCGSNGAWKSIKKPCVLTCNDIAEADEATGYALWSQTSVGEAATGLCIDGYEGSPTRSCGSDGVWRNISNACTKKIRGGYEEFSYMGSPQSFIVPEKINQLTIQSWGAQGGNCLITKEKLDTGGKGGYVKGNLSVISGEILQIYIGGQGEVMAGGWNGGGSAGYLDGYELQGGGGGGASDIRLTKDLDSRKIIAGGGGGCGASASMVHVGQAGGGEIKNVSKILGLGEGKYYDKEGYHGGAGGGGYYGGVYGEKGLAGGGGSGYIGGVSDGNMSNNIKPKHGFMRICWDGHTQCALSYSSKKCKQISYESVMFEETNALSNAVGTCLNGYSGKISRYCNAEGEWGDISGKCSKACDNYPFKDVYHVMSWSGGSIAHDSIVTGKCVNGYTGIANLTCNDGEWVENSQCYTNCSNYPPIDFYNVTNWKGDKKHSDKIKGVCSSDYKGKVELTCNNGIWEDQKGECLSKCPAVKSAGLSTGYATWKEAAIGSLATGDCVLNFSGTVTRKCVDNGDETGRWEKVFGQCIDLSTVDYIEFSYSGSSQSFVVPENVKEIVVQTWGAQGGNCYINEEKKNTGGKGGYAKGALPVTLQQKFFVFVGGKGGIMEPGWNGGGGSGYLKSGTIKGGGGGGSSDIRLNLDLDSRKIVAGGGGGCGVFNSIVQTGGDGGGKLGGNGSNNGQGATQISAGVPGGNKGIGGGKEYYNKDGYLGGGGGSGLYGGGYGSNGAGGGGGSGYIGGVFDSEINSGTRLDNGFIRICWNNSEVCNDK